MLYVIIVLLALLVSLLFSKIKLFCEYKKLPGEKLYTDLHISVGFIRLDRFLKSAEGKSKHTQKHKTEDEDGIILKLKAYAKTFKTVKNVYAQTRWHIRKSLKVENMDFHIKFGLENAAATGIATGAIWSVLYSLTALVAHVGTLKKHYFEVVPVYTEKGLITQGSVSLSIRMINAISLSLRLYLTYRKVTKINK